MSKNSLLSIAIPTYNGDTTLTKTLNSIIYQIENLSKNQKRKIEIILVDDNSKDDTYSIIESYANKYKYIKGFKNESNYGMDKNFRKVVFHSEGKYIWFSGQDDIFLEGAISKIFNILNEQKNIGVISLNYKQYNHDLTKVLCDSALETKTYFPDKISREDDYFFKSSEEYFSVFYSAPSFLPATIMKREYWINTDLDDFIGTHYIQVANILLNMNKDNLYVVTKPYIIGRIPSDRWQSNGTKLFEIMTGKLKMQKMVFEDKRNPYPEEVYTRFKTRYLLNYFFLVYNCKFLGLEITTKTKGDLKYIFKNKFLFNFYIHPVLKLPFFLHKSLYLLLNPLKQALKNINSTIKKFKVSNNSK